MAASTPPPQTNCNYHQSGGETFAPHSGANTPPDMDALISELRSAVAESLRLYIYPDALFYAERLFDLLPSYRHLHALADALLRSGDAPSAVRLLQVYNPFFEISATRPGSAGPSQSRGAPAAMAVRTVVRMSGGGSEARLVEQPVDLEARWDCHYTYGVCCCRTQRYKDGRRALTELLRVASNLEVHYAAGGGGNGGVGAQHHFYWRRTSEITYWLGVCEKQLSLSSEAVMNFKRSVRAAPLRFAAFTEYVNTAEHPDETCLSLYSGDSGEEAAATVPGGARHHDPCTTSAGVASRADHHASRSLTGHKSQLPAVSASTSASLSSVLRMYLRPFAQAVYLLGTYRCAEAQRLLRTFPQAAPADWAGAQLAAAPVAASPWVLTRLGLAFFHDGNMAESAAAFAEALQRAPWRIHEPALVFYSTALWQLKAEDALRALAQQLTEEAPLSAVTLCVVGNAYSLAREPANALVMLRRAVQVDKSMAYAYALRGYELLYMDHKNEADEAFREAIAVDPKLYMAYAGRGEICFRNEQLHYARHFFKAAIQLNPLPTVTNRFAATYHRRDADRLDLEEALKVYEGSLRHHPANLSARHQRADVLLRLGRYSEAQAELVAMIEQCPREAMLWVTLARCAESCGMVQEAIGYYHRAMSLDPRREGYVRGCMERLQAPVVPVTRASNQ